MAVNGNKKFYRKKSMTIRPAVRQAGMGEKDLRFWNVRLIAFQNGINDVAHFSGNSPNTG